MSIEPLNATNMVLIPKIQHPSNLRDFRPISLCTMLYKFITKTMANRLQAMLEECIDCAQSTFIPGHLITDNILVSYEVLHSFKKKLWGKRGSMGLKLDMSKDYDRVEWAFLQIMMEHMGFASS